ncbi:MAG: hypothetical protein H6Q48_3513 [Deltaproteobacteria bacterium]|nr:hypothetical protein [Deltaproteobacteria bacterium]
MVGGAHFVCRQTVEKIILAIEHTLVRTEELVSRADQKVTIKGLHIHRPMGCVLNSINEDKSASRMGHFGDHFHVIDRSHGIGGQAAGHDLRPFGELSLQVVHVEGAVLGMKIHPAQRGARITGKKHPWADVGVMIKASDDHLVPRLHPLRQGAAQAHGQRRHVGTKDDLTGRSSARHVGHGLMSLLQHSIAAAARGEGAAVVRVVSQEVMDHGVYDRLRHLRAAGVVKVDYRFRVLKLR